uniref:HIRA interacting protein 3 n=1 Tax=Nothobranchius kadleci TaxID=1051664 RepID=A0A1A8CSC3_NOTKA
MVPEKERNCLRRFVVDQLRHESDLSTLTLGILKKRYLALVKCEPLSPEAKKFMKQVVEEELLNMQENAENESDSEIKGPQNKRKRETKQKEVESEEEKDPRAKKSRRVSSSSSDSEDEEKCKTGSPKQAKSHATGAEKRVGTDGNAKQPTTSEDDSSDEETKKSEQSESENNESPEKMAEKESNTPKTEGRSPETSDGKESAESDESESGSDGKSEQRGDNRKSSGAENKEVTVEKKTNNSDSGSSSLSSLEDKSKEAAEDSKSKKKVKRDQSSQKNDDKAVVRLKRYIALCGVRRNYKKLLNSCSSTRSKLAVLKKELEDLGVHGNPTIEKCKKVRMKREEAQELAELDVCNIINTKGRPTRRGMSNRQDPPSSGYKRALNSGSDTEEENNPDKGRRKISEWANLRGIISDDADSD